MRVLVSMRGLGFRVLQMDLKLMLVTILALGMGAYGDGFSI